MDDETFSSTRYYSSRVLSSPNVSADLPARRPFSMGTSDYNTGDYYPFSYATPLRHSDATYTIYPESSQRTGCLASDAYDGHLSSYEATFDLDTPHSTTRVSGNGNTRNQPSGTTFGSPNTHVRGHLSTPRSSNPLYDPPSHGMTSYPVHASSLNTTSASTPSEPKPSHQRNSGMGYHYKGGQDYQSSIKPRTPSIPMSKSTTYASSLSSADTTPTFSASTLLGRLQTQPPSPLPPVIEASAGTIQLLQQRPPYGSTVDGRSSVTPPLDSLHADQGPDDKGCVEKPTPASSGITSRTASSPSFRPVDADSTVPLADPPISAGDSAENPPIKKKKKSKMHTCEICTKKFPRPSGLRTHMNTHNNARPYACGFPGCTRTFGVRSNAKRHLRTHGIVPPPSNTTGNSGGSGYVVGFCPPVIAPAPTEPSGGVRTLGANGGLDAAGDTVSGQMAKERMSRTPFFKLRWMPLSLSSRTNAAKLKYVDEMTGEVSEDEGESEGDDDGNDGSDRDRDDYGHSRLDDDDNDGSRSGGAGGGGGARDQKLGLSTLPSLGGNISLPALSHGVPLGEHTSTGSTRVAPSRSSSHSSYSTTSTLTSSTGASGTSMSTSSINGCVCIFGCCLSTPCRSLSGADALARYASPETDDHGALSDLSLGGYAHGTNSLRSTRSAEFGVGSVGGNGAGNASDTGRSGLGSGAPVGNTNYMNLLSLSASATSTAFSLAHGMGIGMAGSEVGGELGFGSQDLGGFSGGAMFGVSNLYARRVGLNAARQAHLLASA